jgi:sporulation protein YlmC with PRC-barrel domain
VELSQGRGAFSELIGRRVRDTSGRSLGHVFEVRAHWEEDGTIVLDELLIGRLGLWRRLRGPGPDDSGIAWENVVEIDENFFTVRGS